MIGRDQACELVIDASAVWVTDASLEVAGVAAATSVSELGMGLLISALSKTEDQPGSIIPLVLIPQLVFHGIVIPFLR